MEFYYLIVKDIPNKNRISFKSILWKDKSFKRNNFNDFYFIKDEYFDRNIDWIKEWPNAISEDDEEEPDKEEEPDREEEYYS